MRFLIITLFVLLFASCLLAEDVLVTRVIDGDTLELVNGRIIRLTGIDAPEKSQPMGDIAKQWLEIYTLERRVTLLDVKRAAYNRESARVQWHNVDVNGSLIQRGFAWVDSRYAPLQQWDNYQLSAQTNKLGVWSDPNRIPPWEWRNGVRKSLPTVSLTQENTQPVVTLTTPTQPSLVTPPILYQSSPRTVCINGRCYQLRP